MHNILVTDPEYLGDAAAKVLGRLGRVTAKRLSGEELEHAIANTDIVVVRVDTALYAGLLSMAKRLKIIGSVTTGLNHIDIVYAKRHGIRVISLAGAHTVSTAEHTIALMLALLRKIPWAYDNLKSGKWDRHKFIGTELNGKVLGLVGIGRIGNTVAKYAKAFGMRVIAYDPYVKSGDIELVGSLKALLEAADVVSLHAALTKETAGMVGAKQFGEMKRGSFLINTARGGIADKDALLHALRSGKLAGAAIDVFESEPIRSNDSLIRYARTHDNLLLTQHIGALTKEAAGAASLQIALGIEKEVKRMKRK